MRRQLAPEIEAQRVAGDPGAGPYGAFKILDPESGRRFAVIASDGRDWAESGLDGGAWEHVSVSSPYGTPTWRQMCWVKSLFFGDDECVVQYHPAAADYVNVHGNCLHLWRPASGVFPMPPKACV